MITLILRGDTVQLFCDFADRDKCVAIPGGKWDKVRRCWEYPAESLLNIAETFKGEKVKADKDCFDLLDSLRYRATILQQIKSKTYPLDEHPFLMYNQKQCRAIARYYPRFAFFLDTGTGKTITALQIIEDKGSRFVVVCPKSIVKAAWWEDQKQWFPSMKLLPLSKNMKKEDFIELAKTWGVRSFGTKDALRDLLIGEAQTYVINPESFKTEVETFKSMNTSGLVVDESTTIKNPQSQITKVVTSFADEMDYVYLLSGKPAPNSQMDYFAQMRVIDKSILGNSFFSFRLKYFKPSGYMGYNWEMLPGAEEHIAEQISAKSIFIRKEDCLDLPEKTYLKRYIELPAEAMKHYMTMEKMQLALFDDDAMTAPNKAAALMKLRQITSGFMYMEDGSVKQLHSARIEELKQVLDEIGDKQVIIWAQFKEEMQQIERALQERCVTAYSETRDVDESIRRFKHGEVQYIVAHPKTLKFGVTFTNCSYAVYYSKSYDYEEYYQSHDRIYRKGQTQPCTFISLIAEDTIDEIMDKVVAGKGTAADVIEELVRMRR